MKECEKGGTRKGVGGEFLLHVCGIYSCRWGWLCMCVGDVGVHESPSWENVCICILWAGMSQREEVNVSRMLGFCTPLISIRGED